jgi:Fe-S cluster biogenesis protein NfuA
VSITKFDVAEWEDVTLELREFIKNHIEEGKKIIISPKAAQTQNEESFFAENIDDISKEIISLLDQYVKPAVASDGGNIAFHSYNPNTKVVKLILQGACSGCPSSTITLKNGIENMLKQMLTDKINSVEAING